MLTLLGLALMGQSLNMMTLGGIAAAVGLVLDDAVVVVEHLAHRAAPNRAALDVSEAMAEISPSLLGSSLCTIVIFVPFMYLDGVAGAFFRVLALTMTLMLGSSLLLCITAIPLLARPKPEPTLGSRRTASWFAQSIQYAVDHPWVAVVPACILIASVLPLRGSLGTGFLPDMDEGSLIMDFYSPAGTSIQETDRILTEVEREISATPEIEAWSRRTGEQLGFFITEPNHGDYVLRLRPRRGRSANEIADDLRRRITHSQAALRVEFGQLVEDVIGDLTTSPQPIEIENVQRRSGFPCGEGAPGGRAHLGRSRRRGHQRWPRGERARHFHPSRPRCVPPRARRGRPCPLCRVTIEGSRRAGSTAGECAPGRCASSFRCRAA